MYAFPLRSQIGQEQTPEIKITYIQSIDFWESGQYNSMRKAVFPTNAMGTIGYPCGVKWTLTSISLDRQNLIWDE